MKTESFNFTGKLALYSGAIKLDKNEDIKIRLLHPLGFLFMIMSFIICIAIRIFEAIIEFRYDMKKELVLW